MADKEGGKHPRSSRAADADDYPVTASQAGIPSGDYAYTVELVGTIQHSLGKLTEAIENLKDQAKERDRKFEDLCKEVQAVGRDVHGAKVAGKALLWVVSVVGALIGIVLGTYLREQFSKPAIPSNAPQQSITAPRNP